ncbi:CGGC domain-containing protein [Methanosarcina sp. KYL-1]|uniref:CGGC domain-containing protein n=1 Tax=Methanosarcina sp. KYL-1 TaxID=2602068 RepID=UPI0021012743|nr:CGGC domain-containing protein [Methanosarcina sp. KYL-1]
MTEEIKLTKIAVVRCETVSESCPGTGCFAAFNGKMASFADYGVNAQMVAYFTCGGCSGRRVANLIGEIKKVEPDAIHLSTCMVKSSACPNLVYIKGVFEEAGIKVVEGTH